MDISIAKFASFYTEFGPMRDAWTDKVARGEFVFEFLESLPP